MEVSYYHTSKLQRHGRLRRQADACMISELLSALLPPLAAKATVHCILEQPVPNALNGEAGSTALCIPVACCINCQQQHAETARDNCNLFC
jgi:hypothetical protein